MHALRLHTWYAQNARHMHATCVYVSRMEQIVNVRLPRALWDAIVALAVKDRRSAAAELAVVVERGLAAAAAAQKLSE
jgi:hypothetical protein